MPAGTSVRNFKSRILSEESACGGEHGHDEDRPCTAGDRLNHPKLGAVAAGLRGQGICKLQRSPDG